MTPDDKRRLAQISPSRADDAGFLCRLLDEATAEASYWRREAHREWDANNVAEVIAERDAAMAALRNLVQQMANNEGGRPHNLLGAYETDRRLLASRHLAAHSATTKPKG